MIRSRSPDPITGQYPRHAKPFLRWAGSKRKLLPKLIPFWSPRYERYIEPFMGSACLFFAIRPEHALLSDINHELVHTFISVRDQAERVYLEMTKLHIGPASYYKIRSLNSAILTAPQQAARFIYLNRFCFNGLYRTNLAGHFNVPYGGAKTGALPSKTDLFRAAAMLNRATLRHSDFEEILVKEVRRGDFVYLDPPFAVTNRRLFRQYGKHTFGLDDVERLTRSLEIIHQRGAHFMLSYAYCKEARAFMRWNVRRLYVQRNISGFARYRRKAAEILVTDF